MTSSAGRRPPEPDRGLSRRHVLLAGIALLVAVVLAYLPALRAGWIWDDDAYVLHNRALRSLGGLRDIWLEPTSIPQWYPMVHTLFWFEWRAFGTEPFGWHLVNVILHAGAALTLWHVLRRLGVPGAFWGAALFALHPVNVESVAWVTERKNVLSGLLVLLSLACWLRRRDPARAADEPPGSVGWWWASFGLFALALLSKSVVATLPCVLLVIVWWKRGRVTWADLRPLLPFLALGVALGLHTAALERRHVGAEGDYWALTLPQRFVIAGRALGFYASKLAWPADLVFIYPRWEPSRFAAIDALFPLAALGVLGGLVAGARRLGRGPAAGALVFAGVLFPALGFLDVYPFRYSFVADHFQYHASIGLLAVAGAGLGRLAIRPGPVRLVPVGVLLLLGSLAFTHARSFHDAETLWRSVVAANPAATIAHNNLGVILDARGERAAAAARFREAVSVDPRNHEAWSNLGSVLLAMGRPEEALVALERSLAIEPDFVLARHLRVAAWRRLGRTEGVEEELHRLLVREPGDREARGMLLDLLAEEGRSAEAVTVAQEGVAVPGGRSLTPRLVRALVADGRAREALAAATGWEGGGESAALHLARAAAHDALGDTAAADAARRAALAVDGGAVEAHLGLARSARAGHDADAEEHHLRRAVAADPRHREARTALAEFLLRTGRARLALPLAGDLVAEDPEDAGARRLRAEVRIALKDWEGAGEDAAVLGVAVEDLVVDRLRRLEAELERTRAEAERLQRAVESGED